MGTLFAQEKSIVVPGEVLAEGMDYLPVGGAFREGEKIIAHQVGIVNVDGRLIKVIPLRGKYLPKKGDVVIGKVMDMTFSNWFVDIDCPSWAALSIKDATEFVERGADLSQFYSFGDFVVARIANVTRSAIDLTMRGPGLRKLGSGRIMRVTSSKVPRIIGREGSMISLIKEKTGCRIVVGQNGLVWIQGEPQNELAAVEALDFVNHNSHQEGLTDMVAQFLAKRMEGVPVPKESFRDEDMFYREQHHEGSEQYQERGRQHYDSRPRRDYRGGYRGGGYRGGGEYRGVYGDRMSSRDRMIHERREMRERRKNLRGGYE